MTDPSAHSAYGHTPTAVRLPTPIQPELTGHLTLPDGAGVVTFRIAADGGITRWGAPIDVLGRAVDLTEAIRDAFIQYPGLLEATR